MTKKKYPEPIVGAIIFNRKKNIFLMKSHKWLDRYVIPGGHVELGEKIEDALKREIKEETNLDIQGIKSLGIQESVFNKGFWKRKHFIFLDYICKTDSSNVKLNHEGQEFIWVSPGKSLKLRLEPYTRTLIENYLVKRK